MILSKGGVVLLGRHSLRRCRLSLRDWIRWVRRRLCAREGNVGLSEVAATPGE